MYQFPMGKVKPNLKVLTAGNDKYQFPMGKVKMMTSLSRKPFAMSYQFPMGKVKVKAD